MEGKSIGFYHEFFKPGRSDLWHKIKRSTNGSKIDRSEIDVDDLKSTVRELKTEVVELRNLVNDLRRISTLQMEMVMRSGFSISTPTTRSGQQHSQQAPTTVPFNNWSSHHTSSIQTHIQSNALSPNDSFPSHSLHGGMPVNPNALTPTNGVAHHDSDMPEIPSRAENIDIEALNETPGSTNDATTKRSPEKNGNQDSNKEEAALALAALSENRPL